MMTKSLLVACCVIVGLTVPATASTRLKNICRVKGQEENTLRGMGLVVGLNGTGEANDPADDAGHCAGDGDHGQPGCDGCAESPASTN